MATWVGTNDRKAVLSEDVANRDVFEWLHNSRGISRTRMAKLEPSHHRRRHQQEAETGAGSLNAIPPAKPRHVLHVVLLLLTLVACRPCHGHDPELFDMDNEDGKFSGNERDVCLYGLTNLNVRFLPLNQTESLSIIRVLFRSFAFKRFYSSGALLKTGIT